MHPFVQQLLYEGMHEGIPIWVTLRNQSKIDFLPWLPYRRESSYHP